ncbi:MAG: VWA domain-containing protein [Nitrospiria bacterium]
MSEPPRAALRARIDVVSSKAAAVFDEVVGDVAQWAPHEVLAAWVELGCVIASDSSVAAIKYFRETPSLLRGVTPERRLVALDVGRVFGRHAAHAALEYIRQCPVLLARLDDAALRQWAEIGADLAREDYGAGIEYVKESFGIAGLIPVDRFALWAEIGLRLSREDAAVKDYLALSYFRSSADWLREIADPGLRPPLLALALRVAAAEGAPSGQRPGQLTVDLLRYAPVLLGSLPTDETRRALLALGTRVAERAPRMVGDFLRHAPEVVRWVEGSIARWTEWVEEGLAIADRHLERAEAYFSLRSKQAIEVAQRLSHGVFLREVKSSLTFYAEALCGCPVDIQAGRGASSARTERGGVITLPERITRYRTPEDNFRFYKVLTLHEAGHLQYGTYEPLSPAAIRWFGGDDRPGEAPATTSLLDRFPDARLAQNLWTIVEEARVDFLLRHEYPGIRRDMDAVLAEQLRGRPPLETLPRRAAILEGLLQLSVADTAEIPLPVLDVVTQGYQLLSRVRTPGATVEDVLRVLFELYPLVAEGLSEDTPIAPAPADQDPQAEFDQLAMGHAPIDSFAFRDTLAAPQVHTTQHGGEPGRTEPAAYRVEDPQTPQGSPAAPNHPGDDETLPASGRGTDDGFWYDEWDAVAMEHKPRWCRVKERPADDGDSDDVEALLAETRGAMRSLVRAFETIRPEAFRKRRRQPDGDEIDLDAALAAAIERRAGLSPVEHYYQRRDKTVRDVAAALLVDVSGSTGRQIHTGGPKPRRVIDVERESLALLGAALHTLGDEYAIYAFSGQGRMDVACRVIKDFETPWSPAVLRRIGGMRPMGQNRDGAAIRHATARLHERPAAIKLLIIISDGRPLDDDYGADYAMDDTRSALQDARAGGVRPFCVTVDERADQYIAAMYRDVQYAIVSDAASLPQRLPRLYRRLTV